VVGACYLDFDVGQPAQRIDDGGHLLAQDVRIRDHGHVCGQKVCVLANKRFQVGTAALFLALKDALDVDGRRARRLLERFYCFYVNVQLSFIVRRATGKDVVAHDGRLEWRGVPFFQRVGGLHVIVPVDEDRGSVVSGRQPLGVNHGVAWCGHNVHFGKPGDQQPIPQPRRRIADVRLVFRLRADAGDAQEFFQFCLELGLICPYVF